MSRSRSWVNAALAAAGLTLASSAPVSAQGGAPSLPPRPHHDGLLPAVVSSEANGVDVPLGGTNEPTIAVNPLNPANVAMASAFTSRVSTDGGVSWTAETDSVVPSGYVQGGDSSLTFDSQGRLFWSTIGVAGGGFGGFDLFVIELDPATGAILAGPFTVTTSGSTAGNFHDKEWLSADANPGSPFADRLYLTWTVFLNPSFSTVVLTSRSDDHGVSWSAALPLSDESGGEGFVWPAHVAVANNGDVFVSYHSQIDFNGIGEAGGNPDGLSGKVLVVRSTDGGLTFPQKTTAFTPGTADVTYNVQSSPGTIAGTDFWLQGSPQAWLLPDPKTPGAIYCVVNDDPDNVHGEGDDADIFIARSNDDGMTWGAPILVEAGPSNSFQVLPTAAIDPVSGCIVVTWYDNRAGALNENGNFLLDLYYTTSIDQGLTFQPAVALNDVPFDPDLGAPVRFFGPPATLRIGEYNGVAMGAGTLQAVWCGNTTNGQQQTIADSVGGACPPWLDIGCALSGVAGDPTLSGTGTLAPQSLNAILTANAAPSAIAALFFSLSSTPAPFKGGTLKALPFLVLVSLVTDPTGAISLPFTMPLGVPAGTELFFQTGISDPAAVQGVSLSNALRGTTP